MGSRLNLERRTSITVLLFCPLLSPMHFRRAWRRPQPSLIPLRIPSQRIALILRHRSHPAAVAHPATGLRSWTQGPLRGWQASLGLE
eukprot:3758157-Pyramimonas_sp.AAC.1